MRHSTNSILAACGLPLAMFVLFCVSVPASAQQPGPELFSPDDAIEATDDDADVEALGRGPLHEAFAEQVNLDAEPSPIVAKKPPEPINELPPEIKPDGEHVEWIPGYWAYDDEELNDFIWVSGVWRKVPPGRRWVPGYWAEVEGGYQWVSGTWASADADEVEVLPPPPESLEQGPNSVADSEEDVWIPGCWVYQNDDYRWRPGYWSAGQVNWIWVPERYIWTPSGCLHVSGYWDYPVTVRGYAFAPYCFHRSVYQRPGYYFSPVVVLDVGHVFANLFVRPSCHHYYFGDYYADTYVHHGFVPWYDYRHHHYCPLLTHYSWYHHRRGVNYVEQLHRYYEYNVKHADYRPYHSLAHLQKYEGRGFEHPGGKDRRYNSDRVVDSQRSRFDADRLDGHRSRDAGFNIHEYSKRSDSKLASVHVEAAQRKALAQSRQQEVRSLIESRVAASKSSNLRPGDHAHAKLTLPAMTEGSLGRRTTGRSDARSSFGHSNVDRGNSIFRQQQQQVQSRIRDAQQQAAEARSQSLTRPDGKNNPPASIFGSKPIVKSKPGTQTTPRSIDRSPASNQIQDRVRDAIRRADESNNSSAPILRGSPSRVTNPRSTTPKNQSNSASQIQDRIRQAQEAARARSQAVERARSQAVERAGSKSANSPSFKFKSSSPPQIQNRSKPSSPPQIQNRSKPSSPPQIQNRSKPSSPPQIQSRNIRSRSQGIQRQQFSRSRSSQSSVSKSQSDRDRRR